MNNAIYTTVQYEEPYNNFYKLYHFVSLLYCIYSIAYLTGKVNTFFKKSFSFNKLLNPYCNANSGRHARQRPAILPHPFGFVNRQNVQKFIFVKTHKKGVRVWRTPFRVRSEDKQE